MQPYHTMPQLLAAGAPQYGIATPTGPVEVKKVMQAGLVPLQGRLTHAPPMAMPAAVAAAPTPTTNSKIQPQLQNLPKFQPPIFENASGALPCPDSPGSTPREGEARLSELQQEEDAEPERPTIFPPGSIVEYKSRSSGHWILAKVENFDEGNGTYRLDVQPHANPERVRARGSACSGSAGGASSSGTGGAIGPSIGSSGGPGGTAHDAENSNERPTTINLMGRSPVEQAAEVESASRESPPVPTQPLATLAQACTPDRQDEADMSTRRLQLEVESLRKQVARLRGENKSLQEQVLQEAALKDRYFQELCLCHEQMQRVRGTPR